MVDPQESASPTATIAAERAARRDTWTLGRVVQLSDGNSWRLPRIDGTLLLFEPNLLAALARTFDLAGDVWETESDVKRHTIATAVYHSQLAQLGVVLLQLNYDLTDERWRQLVSFARLAEMLRLTLAVSEALAEALPAWMPFHLTSGPDGAEYLLCN